MKEKRNLSGIYFRFQNPENQKWENWCFEDLPKEKQQEIMRGYTPDQLMQLTSMLANTLNRIAEHFDLVSE